MADFQAVFADVGRALKAANEAAGRGTPLTYLEVGVGRTAPAFTDTGVETPFVPPRRFDRPLGVAEGDSYVLPWVDDDEAAAYTMYEACWFSGGSAAAGGGTLLWRAMVPGGLAKVANASAEYTFAGRIANAELDSITFNRAVTISAVPTASETVEGKVQLATQAEATADSNQSASKVLSVLRGRQLVNRWWQTLTISASKIPNLDAGKITSGVFSLERIPGLPASMIVSGVLNAARLPPLTIVGEMKPLAGATVPAGWLACDGRAVSRATYASLFAAIGSTWGAGDGSTTFNIPDLRGRVLAGPDGTANRMPADVSDLGESGGSGTHTLTTAQMPSHTHVQQATNNAGTIVRRQGRAPTRTGTTHYIGQPAGGEAASDLTTVASGGGQAHPIIQPTAVVNWIIKT